MLQIYIMKRIVKYPALLILSITFLYAACDDGITPPPYDGPWEKVPVPDALSSWPYSISFTAPDDGWVACYGAVGHYDGEKWEVIKNFNTTDKEYFLLKIITISRTDIWIGGQVTRLRGDSNGVIIHYDGEDWEITELPEMLTVRALWFFPDGTGWGGGSYGFLYYDGTSWELFESSGTVNGFYFLSKNEGWASSLAYIYQWDGVEWTEVLKAEGDTWLYDIDFAAPDDGWAGGYHRMYHYDGTEWKRYEPLYRKDFDAINFLNERFGWGINGKTYYYDGSTWTEYDDGYGYSKYDVFCVSERDVWIASSGGYFLHFSGFLK
jgi:hypothetical protein